MWLKANTILLTRAVHRLTILAHNSPAPPRSGSQLSHHNVLPWDPQICMNGLPCTVLNDSQHLVKPCPQKASNNKRFYYLSIDPINFICLKYYLHITLTKLFLQGIVYQCYTILVWCRPDWWLIAWFASNTVMFFKCYNTKNLIES